MGQWELNEYQCRCGCGKTWRALKEPKPEEMYALATHRPNARGEFLLTKGFNNSWVVAWALKLDDLFEDKHAEAHGDTPNKGDGDDS